jgi:hypothetical protein
MDLCRVTVCRSEKGDELLPGRWSSRAGPFHVASEIADNVSTMAIKLEPVRVNELEARARDAESEDVLAFSVALGEHRAESTTASINAAMYRAMLDHVERRRHRTTA